MTSDTFIGLLQEEYKIRLNCVGINYSTNISVNMANTQTTGGPSKSLEDHIGERKKGVKPYCDFCKCARHWTTQCRKKPSNNCYNCGKPGHYVKVCQLKKKKGKEKTRKKIRIKGGQETNPTTLKSRLVLIWTKTHTISLCTKHVILRPMTSV
jgi:Zinc knuckle